MRGELPLPSADGAVALGGGGEMGARIRAYDWSAGPLGGIDGWPQSLLTAARIMLSSRFAMWMAWGPDLTFLCNDAYRPTLGVKADWALGSRSDRVWSEIWSDIGPRIERVLQTREASWDEGLQLFLERSGFREETYHTFSYSPLADDDGAVSGMLCVVVEETERVVGDRRLRVLRDLASRIAETRSSTEVWRALEAAVEAEPQDAPFVIGYAVAHGEASLAGTFGVGPGSPLAPRMFPVDEAAPWPLAALAAAGGGSTVVDLDDRDGLLPAGPWSEAPKKALVVALGSPGQAAPAAALVVGLNPFRPLDTAYRGFLDLLAGQVASGLAAADAYQAERRRAEALAELDRTKTAFFSNVSHEFRTPLTLMLGPLEEVIGSGDGLDAGDIRARVEMAHRNGLRLLRLVNALLDFSRIEAGRVQASFVPTDLAALTADLASSFRSATDRAGLKLTVETPALSQPVHVDRDMWEKIVLNLVSNAFKFTFDGGITVRLEEDGSRARLTVADTGVGISAEELPRLFERFHRVEGTKGRSFEGSGIGLALVQELVKLHGGQIAVDSEPGVGTRFVISLPLGVAHLPQDRLGAASDDLGTGVRAEAFVDEALRWLPDSDQDAGLLDLGAAHTGAGEGADAAATGRILLADDNADLRAYIARLLSARGYQVEIVPDGEAALEAARARRPDLLLTDVMMPRLDGFGLLRAVRAEPALRDLPIVMLSARAGEEAKVEGFATGADDYLTKPFSSRELLARIAANLQTAKLRRETNAALAESEARFRNMADHAPVMMWVTDPQGRCTYANRAWQTFTGQSEEKVRGFGWIDAIHVEDRPAAERVFRAANDAQAPFNTEYRLRRTDGAWRWALNAAAPRFGADGAYLGYVGSIIDVTERRDVEAALEQRVAEEIAARGEVEEALRQAQKMEAVGQLTGGIAHDFNNLLTIITGNIGITSRALDAAGVEDARARRALDSALKGAERAASLTHRLLAFSRRQPLSPKPTDVDKLVAGMSDLVHRALGETIALEVVTSPGLWRVEVDQNQLESALLNLAVNARDAMPRGGRLTIETANAQLDDAYTAANAEASPGQYVLVAVTDTGEGMPRNTLARVFEPFFTTKEVGKGTGLGLSMVYGFTKQSGGHVKVYSEPGEGTTVKLYLPRLMSAAEGAEPGPAVEADRAHAGHSVLVVEDDADVRAYTVSILRELGYRVMEAHDGASALRLLERRGETVALLFTDVVMPGMSGGELAAKAREIRPDLKVLFTSGYTRNAIVHGGRLDPGVEMISKPFTYQALARKVRDVLELGATGTVLVIEGEAGARTSLTRTLTEAGYVARQAVSAAEGLGTVRASQGRLDAVVVGAPSDKSTLAMAVELRALYADLPLLVLAGEDAERLRQRFAGDRCVGWLDPARDLGQVATALAELGVSCRGG